VLRGLAGITVLQAADIGDRDDEEHVEDSER
jgi:hypothetical protein